jgi:hypothetical protein
MQGLAYDVASDSYHPVDVSVGGVSHNRELAPLFEAIFAAAPALPPGMDPTSIDNPVLAYLTKWNEILWQIYPDYKPSGEANLLGGTVAVDQAYIMQMLVAAHQSVPIGIDLVGAAHALSIDESRIITHVVDTFRAVNTVPNRHQGRPNRATAACNDNTSWRGATFCFVEMERVA